TVGERAIVVARGGEVDLHDPRTGALKWTVKRPGERVLWSSFEITSGATHWRSDGWNGAVDTLAWDGQTMEVASPAVRAVSSDLLALAGSLGWLQDAQGRPVALSQRRLPDRCNDRAGTDAAYAALPLLAEELHRWMAVRCVAAAAVKDVETVAEGWA